MEIRVQVLATKKWNNSKVINLVLQTYLLETGNSNGKPLCSQDLCEGKGKPYMSVFVEGAWLMPASNSGLNGT